MAPKLQLMATFCLVSGLVSWQVAGLALPAQTTTTTEEAPSEAEPAPDSASPPLPPTSVQGSPDDSPNAGTETLYTTKRNAVVIIDWTTTTQFPLPVVNAEKDSIAYATLATAPKSPGTRGSSAGSQPVRDGTKAPLYRLNGSNGQACILLQVDALITINYNSKIGEKREADVYVPDDPTITGSCDEETKASMSLKWGSYVLSWYFAKSPGGERWYVDRIELTYNSSDKHFEHPVEPNKTVRLSSAQKHHSIFPTPVGKSFVCVNEEQEIHLTDGKNEASILLRELKLQPFKFKSNDFATEFSCASLYARASRSETAPLAVGSTLAAVTLLTITGYAGWRHFKIKKVDYNTME